MNKFFKSAVSLLLLLLLTPSIKSNPTQKQENIVCVNGTIVESALERIARVFREDTLVKNELFLSTILSQLAQEDSSFQDDLQQIARIQSLMDYKISNLAPRVKNVFHHHNIQLDLDLITARLLEAKLFEGFKLFFEGKEKLRWKQLCEKMASVLEEIEQYPAYNKKENKEFKEILLKLSAEKDKFAIGKSLFPYVQHLPKSLHQYIGVLQIRRLLGLIVL